MICQLDYFIPAFFNLTVGNSNFSTLVFVININNCRSSQSVIENIIFSHSPLFIGFAESRLKPGQKYFYVPEGCILIWHDRTLCRAGGVALLLREDFVVIEVLKSVEMICVPPKPPKIEFLALRLLHHLLQNLSILVSYPPSLEEESYQSFFEQILVISIIGRCILMGDFNYSLGRLDSDSSGFINFVPDTPRCDFRAYSPDLFAQNLTSYGC